MDLYPYLPNCAMVIEMYIFALFIVISNIEWIYQYGKIGHRRAKHYSVG
jgi:hypothetical protein